MDPGLKVVYHVYNKFTRDLANSLSIGIHDVDKYAYMLHNTPFSPIKRVEL